MLGRRVAPVGVYGSERSSDEKFCTSHPELRWSVTYTQNKNAVTLTGDRAEEPCRVIHGTRVEVAIRVTGYA